MRRSLFTVLSVIGLLATGLVAGWAAGGTGTVDPPPKIAFLANGINPADALAAGAIAGQLGAPLFTTNPATLEDAARDGLAAYQPELLIVLGGPVAVSQAAMDAAAAAAGLTVVTDPDARPDEGAIRVAGDNRYLTAAAVAALLGDYDVAFLPVDGTALGALDADTATSADTADTADFADEAGDADTVDGFDAADLLSNPTVNAATNDEAFASNSNGSQVSVLSVDVEATDACGDGSTLTRYKLEYSGSVTLGSLDRYLAWEIQRGPTGDVGDGARVFYTAINSASVPTVNSMPVASTQVFDDVPVGTSTFRVVIEGRNGNGVPSVQNSHLIATRLGHVCTGTTAQ